MKYRTSLLALLITGLNIPAQAVPVSLSANGVIWTLSGDAVPGVSTTGSFTLTANASGWDLGGTAYLSAFSLKNFGSSATLSDLTAPAGTWDWVNQGLNANGCKTKTNGTADALCMLNTGNLTTGPSTGSIFSFKFDISLNDVFPEYTHFKVHWVKEDGNKVGDLISLDITGVPEPEILILLAVGLAGIGAVSTLSERAES